MSDDSVCGHFFFFKQKTAYEMRISDWSSDVCSSDLSGGLACREPLDREPFEQAAKHVGADSPCRHVELEFPRDDLRDQAHRLQPLDPEIVEADAFDRSEEHTSELQSLMRISYAVFCLQKKTDQYTPNPQPDNTYTAQPNTHITFMRHH